ncbi:ring finger protein [Planoprotostelium fungivorum]|uniref:Ring finger protein n=1 Tax=Planoprotostelium fungivorum TaxID=1890364 RepID=A0A2P6NM64_9EUKA|nr:ring finger protein [Planoprotostelium fungivorum]
MKKGKEKKLTSVSLECIICKDQFSFPILSCHCGRSYCQNCILAWLDKNDSCPLCLQRIKRLGRNWSLEGIMEDMQSFGLIKDIKKSAKRSFSIKRAVHTSFRSPPQDLFDIDLIFHPRTVLIIVLTLMIYFVWEGKMTPWRGLMFSIAVSCITLAAMRLRRVMLRFMIRQLNNLVYWQREERILIAPPM